jgi:hypothetical protein
MDTMYGHDVGWRELCEQASKESDPHRLIELVQRLNELLEDPRVRREQWNPY